MGPAEVQDLKKFRLLTGVIKNTHILNEWATGVMPPIIIHNKISRVKFIPFVAASPPLLCQKKKKIFGFFWKNLF